MLSILGRCLFQHVRLITRDDASGSRFSAFPTFCHVNYSLFLQKLSELFHTVIVSEQFCRESPVTPFLFLACGRTYLIGERLCLCRNGLYDGDCLGDVSVPFRTEPEVSVTPVPSEFVEMEQS